MINYIKITVCSSILNHRDNTIINRGTFTKRVEYIFLQLMYNLAEGGLLRTTDGSCSYILK